MQHVVLTLVQKGDEFAMLQRKDGRWTFPGGKVEPNETVGQAARRETSEEGGIEIEVLDTLTCRYDENNFYVYAYAAHRSGELKVNEPDKFLKAEWMKAAQVMNICRGHAPVQVMAVLEAADHASRVVIPKSGLNFG